MVRSANNVRYLRLLLGPPLRRYVEYTNYHLVKPVQSQGMVFVVYVSCLIETRLRVCVCVCVCVCLCVCVCVCVGGWVGGCVCAFRFCMSLRSCLSRLWALLGVKLSQLCDLFALVYHFCIFLLVLFSCFCIFYVSISFSYFLIFNIFCCLFLPMPFLLWVCLFVSSLLCF